MKSKRWCGPGHLLLHPGYCVALVTLVLNDHWLKQWRPSMATGKLSDAAGLVVAPVLAVSLIELVQSRRAALLRRERRLLIWAVSASLSFSLIQLCLPAAELYAAGLGGVQGVPSNLLRWAQGKPIRWHRAQHTMDPTDLYALPFAFLGYFAAKRQLALVEHQPGGQRHVS